MNKKRALYRSMEHILNMYVTTIKDTYQQVTLPAILLALQGSKRHSFAENDVKLKEKTSFLSSFFAFT